MLTLFMSRRTWLHSQPAGRKLSVLALASLCMLMVSSPLMAMGALALVVSMYFSLGAPGRERLYESLQALAWLIGFIAGAQIIIAGMRDDLSHALFASVWVSMAKLVALVLLAELVSITTPLQALINAVLPLLMPLRAVGLSPRRLSLAMGLIIRLVSLQRRTWLQLRQSWAARSKIKPGLRIVPPIFRLGLKQADHMARALRARSASDTEIFGHSGKDDQKQFKR